MLPLPVFHYDISHFVIFYITLRYMLSIKKLINFFINSFTNHNLYIIRARLEAYIYPNVREKLLSSL